MRCDEPGTEVNGAGVHQCGRAGLGLSGRFDGSSRMVMRSYQRRGAPGKEIAEGMEAPEHRTIMETADGRLTAFGNQLIEVHLWLREELAALRENIDTYLAGDARPRELRAHCLTFCSALNRHHTGENDRAFPELAERFPELRPVLDELRRDHRLVEESLRRLEALLGGLGQTMNPVEVRGELDGLAALMATHFVYEEKRIVSALNALNAPDWDRSRPDFLLLDDAEP
jgi:hypothetical protein